MVAKTILRIISGIMFIVAVIFLSLALTHPEFGTVFYIGTWEVGSAVWRAFYVAYAITTILLFVLSFFVGRGVDQRKE